MTVKLYNLLWKTKELAILVCNDHAISNEDRVKLNDFLNALSKNQILTNVQVEEVEAINTKSMKAKHIEVKTAAIRELTMNLKLDEEDKVTAKDLLKEIIDNKTLNTNSDIALNALLSKQTDLAIRIYQQNTLTAASQIYFLSRDQHEEIKSLNAKLGVNNLNSTEINKIQLWLDKCTPSVEDREYYKRIQKQLDENKIYEHKYPRLVKECPYSVIIKGKHINEFDNTMEARFKEIKRCKPVKMLLSAGLFRDSQPGDEFLTEEELLNKMMNKELTKKEKRFIKIEVGTYEDQITLMQPWTFDAFGSGVKPYLVGIPKLPITFVDVA